MAADTEIYPMPLFVRLHVSDVAESKEWYESLGFEVIYSTPVMAHVRYRMYADLLLTEDGAELDAESLPTGTPRGAGVSIYVNVKPGTIEIVAEQAKRVAGADIEGPVESSWNTREVTVPDPDGYELVFTEAVTPQLAYEDTVGESNRP